MANTYDGVDHVNVGDPTLKAHYDQLRMNAVVLALIDGRVLAKAGLNIAWTDATAFTIMPESYEFTLPAAADVGGITVRMVGFLMVEAGGQTGSVRLEYWDGIAWVAVASSTISFTSTSPVYTESVNIQANLNATETRYRFTSKVNTAGQRMRGYAWLMVKG